MKYNIDGKEVDIRLSFDDGCGEDVRVADMLRRYRLPAMFYIPSSKRELTDLEVRNIAKDFEIGSHTKNHRFLRHIPPPEANAEIIDGKRELEAVIGRKITSFCYPRGRFNDEVKRMVREAGFTEGRTTRVLATRLPNDPYELDTTIHIYDRTEYEGINWLKMAIMYFDRVLDIDTDDDYFHLWGHGWEIARFNYWTDFDHLLNYIAERLHQQP